MQSCSGQYGVFLNGKWQWYRDYSEAARIEAEELRQKVERKLVSGGTVILTREMWKQVETALKSECIAPQSQAR